MLFLDHLFKWFFAALLALFATLILGGVPFALSSLFISPPRHGIAHRSIDASNLRQICQASLIYASDNQDRLPDARDLPDYARLLALGGGLNEPSIWLGSVNYPKRPTDLTTVLINAPDGTRALDPRFAQLPHLFTVVLGGLTARDAPTTPIAWTRGLDLETGRWRSDSPYGGDGGHIAFLNGKVSFYHTLRNFSGGELTALDGRPTHRIRDALPPQARLSADPATQLQSLAERLREPLHRTPAPMRTVITFAWPLWMLALFFKITLATMRTWGVPISRVGIESRPRWLILTPVALLLLSFVFRL